MEALNNHTLVVGEEPIEVDVRLIVRNRRRHSRAVVDVELRRERLYPLRDVDDPSLRTLHVLQALHTSYT